MQAVLAQSWPAVAPPVVPELELLDELELLELLELLDVLELLELLPLLVHTLLMHWLLPQSAFEAHCTQLPAPSQTVPPLETHGVSAAFGIWIGTLAVHAPVVQSLVAAGTSVVSVTVVVPPMPSQTICWQSPGIWMESAVPMGANAVLQTPFVQEGCSQSVVAPGHWLATEHAPPLVLVDAEDVLEAVLPAPLPLELEAPPVPEVPPPVLDEEPELLVLDALLELVVPVAEPAVPVLAPPIPEPPELDPE
jgi:hypothetical protein